MLCVPIQCENESGVHTPCMCIYAKCKTPQKETKIAPPGGEGEVYSKRSLQLCEKDELTDVKMVFYYNTHTHLRDTQSDTAANVGAKKQMHSRRWPLWLCRCSIQTCV